MSAPSGIAQLRKSIDHSNEQQSDPMNLDDFLVPNSTASPAGMTPSPEERSTAAEHARASVMSIQSRKAPNYHSTEPLPMSSVPPPSIISNRNGEFDYVQRRVRKTSIDEGRVSHVLHEPNPAPREINDLISLENVLPSSLLMSHRQRC
jgi:GATA-binding protein